MGSVSKGSLLKFDAACSFFIPKFSYVKMGKMEEKIAVNTAMQIGKTKRYCQKKGEN